MFQDIRHGLRSLMRTPSFVVAALLTLALGIGSTAAIFSIAYAVLLKPLPYPDADRLFVLASPGPSTQPTLINTSQTGEIFHYLRDRIRSLENIAAHGGAGGWNLISGTHAEHVTGMTVSRGYFDVIGVRPAFGRGFSVAEDQPGGPRAVILSDQLSRRLFDGRVDVLGKSIQLGGVPHAVVGVMPASYWQASQTATVDLWTPLRASPSGNSWNYPVIGRLRAGVSEVQLAAELDAMRWNLQRDVRDLSAERAGVLQWMSYQKSLALVHRDQLVLLSGAVGALLLIACVNVASLQIVRGVSRRREMATRAALGGGRGRLIRQVLTESLLLALGGAALGLLVAVWGLDVLVSHVPAGILGSHVVEFDGRVVATVLGLTVAAGLLFGIAPALNVAHIDVRTTLVEGGRHSVGRHTMRLRRVFTGAQSALAVVLLVSAGLLIRSFVNCTSAPLGFDPANVVIGKMSMQGSSMQVQGGVGAMFQRTLLELRRVPGVAAVAVANSIPVERGLNLALRPPTGGVLNGVRSVDWRWISPDYFAAFRISLRDGRTFDDRDHASSAPVAIVNEAFAKLFFGRPNVVGESIRLMGNDPGRQIVGVVTDVKARSGAGWTRGLNALAAPAPPAMYVPVAQLQDASLTGGFPISWIVRTSSPSANVVPAVRQIVQGSAPLLPLLRIEPMDEVVARDLEMQRFLMFLVGAFASVAMGLALIGMYGLTAYAVSQRSQEVGIRMALGATAQRVVRGFLAEGVSVALFGLAIGLVGAAFATRILTLMIFDVAPQDPVTLVVVSVVLVTMSIIATLIPSLQAARTNPARVMRAE
jgi:putative ABC transport system permease protein